jgi:hypothetical protein
VLDFIIAAVTSEAAVKPFAMDEVEQLREHVLTRVHDSRIAASTSFGDKSILNRSYT